MQGELSRSKFAQETLEQSTAALADLGEKYTDLNTLLANSKSLVTTLLKSTKSDTWYLETAFYILITTIIWLIFRRWLYGPITWFIWWPLKLVYRLAFAIYSLAGASSASSTAASHSREPRTSLIIKPSASGGIPKRVVNINDPPPSIRIGLGGKGYHENSHIPKSQTQSLSEGIGEMVEQQQQQQNQQQEQDREQQGKHQERVVRGDGTVLQERDQPANPKKRIWEENEERKKYNEAQVNEGEKKHVLENRDEL